LGDDEVVDLTLGEGDYPVDELARLDEVARQRTCQYERLELVNSTNQLVDGLGRWEEAVDYGTLEAGAVGGVASSVQEPA
jgi:hypothetical protein